MKVSIITFWENQNLDLLINSLTYQVKEIEWHIVLIIKNEYDANTLYQLKTKLHINKIDYSVLILDNNDLLEFKNYGKYIIYLNADSYLESDTIYEINNIFSKYQDVNCFAGKKCIESNLEERKEKLCVYSNFLMKRYINGYFINSDIVPTHLFIRNYYTESIIVDKFISEYIYNLIDINDIYSVDKILVVDCKINYIEGKRLTERDALLEDSFIALCNAPYTNKVNNCKVFHKRSGKWIIGNERKRKRLSIITVCYNEKYIESTCESIYNQTFQDFEWIIVDGGSSEKYIEIINKYKRKIDKFISEKDSGIYNAMNKGIKVATGDFITFMNGGDFYSELFSLEKIFAKEFDNCVLYGDEIRIKDTGKKQICYFPDRINKFYFCNRKNYLPHQSTFYFKKLFDQYGGYDEAYKIVADTEKHTQLITNKVKFCKINQIIAVHNQDGISSKKEFNDYREYEKRKCRNMYYSVKDLNKYGLDCTVTRKQITWLKISSFDYGREKNYYLFGKILLFKIKNYY